MLASAARISGRVVRPSVARWSSPGGLRVLVVAPHPDDESVGCAGTIIRHLASADDTTIVYATDGSGSRALGLTAGEMRQRRREEARAACGQLGVERIRWLGLDEREWNTGELTSLLTGLLRELAPDVIYTPSRIDFHPDHHRVAHAVARALGQQSRSVLVRAYQIQVPLTGILINLIVDVSPHEAEIRSALDQYVTQRATIATTLRLRRYQSRYYGHPSVEVFWEMAVDRFVRLHEDPPSSWRATPFRGVRPRPFTDPLAFWFGRGERRACCMPPCSER
jgi:LmbE family N-acetylglucosaminyl deacetylase